VRDQLGENNFSYKHGGFGTRLYRIWFSMKARCFNSNNKFYKNYGGRGIKVCNKWLEFIPFRDWALNNGYAENLEIDRIDNDKGYYPENCHWTTTAINCQNRGNMKIKNMEMANEIRTLYTTGNCTYKELAKKYNVSISTISVIINNKQWRNGVC